MLDEIDLIIYCGEVLVIIGLLGIGKFIVLRIIVGLLIFDVGEVYV